MRYSFLLAIAFVAAGGSVAHAQPQPGNTGVRSPAFSPYLNLVRGNNPTANYFGIVRPGQQLLQQTSQLQQQLSQTNQSIAGGQGAGNQLFTGRGAVFGYYSHYYYNSPAGRGGYGGSRYGGGGVGFGGIGGGGFGGVGGGLGGAGFAGGGGAMSVVGRSGAVSAPQARSRPAGGRR